MVSPSLVEEHLEWTRGELNAALTVEGQEDKLGMPGIETILGFIAIKIVVPAIASFVGRVLYDKYLAIRTTSLAEEGLVEISTVSQMPQQSAPVAPEIVIADLTRVAVAEGVAEEDARELVTKLLERLRADIRAV
jgi:hypothetical protein